ncbi:MAG: aminotransferase class V-fold PLP-dependent enzyme [candidate division Zixibacteria bacterium]|nr:aminotransferase class V-fold PLP-dependent enzyme [candidate division Zixibacteria bacterium]
MATLTTSKPTRKAQTSPAAVEFSRLRDQLIGVDARVPLLDGRQVPYVNFDNAASTPTFRPIAAKVDEFLTWYSNVHRGTGFKSQLSSWVFEQARERIAGFVRADLSEHIVIFTKNATEAINKLAHRLEVKPGDVILTSLMEHHSNELPWRKIAHVEHIGLDEDGRLSAADFRDKLRRFGSRVRLVAITGASNVSGYINDLGQFARGAHSVGAEFLVDAAQLAPHRPMSMGAISDPAHIDYLVFSAHKMYAPYGVGILVGRRAPFEHGDPDTVGGGTVDIVNLEEAYWTDLPDKEEAGTPDIVGVVALATAIGFLQAIGWERIVAHEAELTACALQRLAAISGLHIHGDSRTDHCSERLGVISFSVDNVPHNLVAAVLNYEYGIGVRSGCFCAHTYVKCLLHVNDADAREMERQILARDRTRLPGTVRVSFGIYNTTDEIDRLAAGLSEIAAGRIRGDYVLNAEKGEYAPRGYDPDFSRYFRL